MRRNGLFILVGWVLFLGFGEVSLGQGAFETLDGYIASLHWDSKSSGVLISIQPESTRPIAQERSTESPRGRTFADFGRKMVRFGSVNAVVPSLSVAYEETDIPSGYDGLDSTSKIAYLLATLSESDFEKLTGSGISPSELQGQQKAAALSLMPQPFSYTEATVTGIGGTESHSGSLTLSRDQLESVKLRVGLSLDIFLERKDSSGEVMQDGLDMIHGPDYRGLPGTAILREGETSTVPHLAGHVIDNEIKKGDLSWTDSRLDRTISLSGVKTFGGLFDMIREQTATSIYSDYRLRDFRLSITGAEATARDLLKALALSVSATFRKVGGTYLLCKEIEGEKPHLLRLEDLAAFRSGEVSPTVNSWFSKIFEENRLNKLRFSQTDPLFAGTIPSSLVTQGSPLPGDPYIPITSLPRGVQAALSGIFDEKASEAEPSSRYVRPTFAQLRSVPIYEWVLPDGRPLGAKEFDLNSGARAEAMEPEKLPSGKRVDTATLPVGSVVEVSAPDDDSAAKLANALKSKAIKSVWVDTQSPSVVQTFIRSGLEVGLIVRPWRLLKGESCADPDLDLMGQSARQQAGSPELPQLIGKLGDSLSNIFSPSDPDLSLHWDRLLNFAAQMGVGKVIFEDCQPFGYSGAPRLDVSTIPFPENLTASQLEEHEFGYSVKLREQFVKKYGADPLDLSLDEANGEFSPYFDRVTPFADYDFAKVGIDNTLLEYPGGPTNPGQVRQLVTEWSEFRRSAAKAAIASLLERGQRLKIPMFSDLGRSIDSGVVTFSEYSNASVSKPKALGRALIDPFEIEEVDGIFNLQIPTVFSSPICIDFSQVPPDRVIAYIERIFSHVAEVSPND